MTLRMPADWAPHDAVVQRELQGAALRVLRAQLVV